MVLVSIGQSSEANQLLSRFPLVLGPLSGWLSAYVQASHEQVDEARGKTSTLDPPPPEAPFPMRPIVAAALGSMKDNKRGHDVVLALVREGLGANPDIAAAANALGIGGSKSPRKR